ncbi:hypothetical protein CMUS01_05881 [Colletotrichum musicola]|uniref:Uncharacterized protein n=1 Tax=Colletotrichum musicola TaxID=2175873 RepID=A0A8H6KP22_9PEZI|nr:hypothetical protein CMUS01_05881 [Colletotrichum musicola]
MANRQPIQENTQRRREELERKVPNVPPRAGNQPGPSRGRPANALRIGSRALSGGLRARRRQRNSDSEALVEENDEVGGNRNSHVEVPNDDTLANHRPANDGTVDDGLVSVNNLLAHINQLKNQISNFGWGNLASNAVFTILSTILILVLVSKIPTEPQPVPELPSEVPTSTITETVTVTDWSTLADTVTVTELRNWASGALASDVVDILIRSYDGFG